MFRKSLHVTSFSARSVAGPWGWIRLLTVLSLTLPGSLAAQAPEPDGRGWLGLYIRDLDGRDIRALELASDQEGVVVSGVDDDGPAAAAGIEPGDVLVSLDGRRIDSRADFVQRLDARRVGDRVRLQVLRRNTMRQVAFALQERPREMQGPMTISPGARPDAPAVRRAPMATLLTWPLQDARLADDFGLRPGTGLLVLQVSGEGLERLQPGDVILSVDDRDIDSAETLREALQGLAGAERSFTTAVTVRVSRDRRTRNVRLPAEVLATITVADAGLDRQSTPATGTAWQTLQREILDMQRRLRELEAQVDAQVRR